MTTKEKLERRNDEGWWQRRKSARRGRRGGGGAVRVEKCTDGHRERESKRKRVRDRAVRLESFLLTHAERERDRQTDRQTDRHGHRHGHRHRHRHRHRHDSIPNTKTHSEQKTRRHEENTRTLVRVIR